MRFVMSLVVMTVAATVVLAAPVKKRVEFARGASKAVVSGTVKNGDEVEYVLRAGKGQTLTVRMTSDAENNDAVFSIRSPSGKSLMGGEGDDYGTEWSGKLPEAGDYAVVPGLIETRAAKFKMEIAIR